MVGSIDRQICFRLPAAAPAAPEEPAKETSRSPEIKVEAKAEPPKPESKTAAGS